MQALAHLHEHVVLRDEVTGHGMQAAAKHRAQQQVDDGLEAAGVNHRRVKRQHHRDVDQVRWACSWSHMRDEVRAHR
jgi:hypothetical protein